MVAILSRPQCVNSQCPRSYSAAHHFTQEPCPCQRAKNFLELKGPFTQKLNQNGSRQTVPWPICRADMKQNLGMWKWDIPVSYFKEVNPSLAKPPLTHFPCIDWENIYTLSYYHHRIGSMNYYPLFRVRSWNNGVHCMSFCILIEIQCELILQALFQQNLQSNFLVWKYVYIDSSFTAP